MYNGGAPFGVNMGPLLGVKKTRILREKHMHYVVTEPCIKCKFTDCVSACPVDSFREGENFLVIDPEECIDCGACVPECPVEAIFEADDVPEKWTDYIELNERLAADWPSIEDQQDPMDSAEDFKDVSDKRGLLSEAPAG